MAETILPEEAQVELIGYLLARDRGRLLVEFAEAPKPVWLPAHLVSWVPALLVDADTSEIREPPDPYHIPVQWRDGRWFETDTPPAFGWGYCTLPLWLFRCLADYTAEALRAAEDPADKRREQARRLRRQERVYTTGKSRAMLPPRTPRR